MCRCRVMRYSGSHSDLVLENVDLEANIKVRQRVRTSKKNLDGEQRPCEAFFLFADVIKGGSDGLVSRYKIEKLPKACR